MTGSVAKSSLLLAQEYLRSTTIFQWAENLVKVSVWRNIHNEALQTLAIFYRVVYGLVNIGDFEVGLQIAYILLEKACQ